MGWGRKVFCMSLHILYFVAFVFSWNAQCWDLHRSVQPTLNFFHAFAYPFNDRRWGEGNRTQFPSHGLHWLEIWVSVVLISVHLDSEIREYHIGTRWFILKIAKIMHSNGFLWTISFWKIGEEDSCDLKKGYLGPWSVWLFTPPFPSSSIFRKLPLQTHLNIPHQFPQCWWTLSKLYSVVSYFNT